MMEWVGTKVWERRGGIVSGGDQTALPESGQQVGHDKTAAADKYEIVGVAVVQGGLVGFGYRCVHLAPQTFLGGLVAHDAGRHGTRYRGLGEVVDRRVREHGQHTRDVLVVDHAEDDAQGRAFYRGELLHDILKSAHVVACVAVGAGREVHLLPAALQSGECGHMGKAFAHGFGGDGKALLAQQAQGAEQCGGILFLAESPQFVGDEPEVAAVDGPLSEVVFAAGGHHVAFLGKEYRGRLFSGFLLEDAAHIAFGFADDDRYAAFDDAGLFVGDGRERVAEQGHVVVADVGDDTGAGRDDVGAVETPAETGLDDRHIDVAGGEVVKGHHHRQFKKRRVYLAACVEVFAGKFENRFARNHFAVDPYAFSEIDQVRRGIQSHPVAALLEYGGQNVAGRPLAVGAGNVYGGVAAMGVPHQCVESQAVAQSRLVGRLTHLLEDGKLTIEILKRFFVVHGQYIKNPATPASTINNMAFTLKKKLAASTAPKMSRLTTNCRVSPVGEPKFSVFISTRAAEAMSPMTAGRNPANVSVTCRLSWYRIKKR